MAFSLNILAWHVHGSWSTAFVQGRHHYLIPHQAQGGPWGLGFSGRRWPAGAEEVDVADLAELPIDVMVLQRPEELELAQRWTGRRPGVDVPAVYVEHNTPRESAVSSRHPLAGQRDIPVVHVTHFNELMWDCGDCPTSVIPHGIPDPGQQYTGELDRAVALINEPVRRWRITGTDLLPAFARISPVDVFGIDAAKLPDRMTTAPSGVHPCQDLDQETLHREMGRRRYYLHTARWTSLGLSLLEAMFIGMPVVALGCTEAPLAVPPEGGAVATDLATLTASARHFIDHPEEAATAGKHARAHALRHFGLEAFLRNWDELLSQVVP
jgi:glycosyltransferase involved in cell wall biosynthesis